MVREFEGGDVVHIEKPAKKIPSGGRAGAVLKRLLSSNVEIDMHGDA